MLEMWESLLSDYDYAVVLLNGDGITSPSDLQNNKMLGSVLVATTRYYGDFTQFRREATTRMS
jgi:hypothetical protein